MQQFRKKLAISYPLLSGLLLVAGCISGGKQLPTASPNFAPRVTYTLNYDSMWADMISTLNRNQIQIISATKDTGQINTGYIEGPSAAVLPIAGNYSRYKYNIFLSREGPTKTTVVISPVIESAMIGDGSSFHDVTSANTGNAARLKNWLYEQLELSTAR